MVVELNWSGRPHASACPFCGWFLQEAVKSVDDRLVGLRPLPVPGRAVGVVGQQEEAVFPLSVAETVMLGRYARLGLQARVPPTGRALLGALALRLSSGLAQRLTDSLSWQQWKRYESLALAQEPRAPAPIELTASLIGRHEMELFELFRQLVDGGLAGLVITHHLNLAARFAHRIVLLDRGAVVAVGTPAEVLRRETLSRVFEWPVAVTTWSDGSARRCAAAGQWRSNTPARRRFPMNARSLGPRLSHLADSGPTS